MKILFAAAVAATLAACEKEGPIGPQGEQGPAGENGSANVHSATSPPMTFEPEDPVPTFDYILTWSMITQNIIDDGVVLGYVSTSGGWTPLNYFVPLGGELLMYRGFVEPGQYRVNMKFSDGGLIDVSDPLDSMNPLVVKVVIIEGGRSMSASEIERLVAIELSRSPAAGPAQPTLR
jgi:hypothetical protein